MPNHSQQKFLKTWTVTRFFLARVSNVPVLGFRNRVSILSTYLLFYTLRYFDILFLIIMPNHSSKKFLKTWTVTWFLQHVFQTSRYGVFKLGFRFEALFHCFIHSVSSTFYSKSSSLNIPHKSFEKHGQLLGYFSMCFKRPGLGFPNQVFNLKLFFTALYTPFLQHSIRNQNA